MIRLHTLGTLDLSGSDGHEIRSILAQPKRLALLVYLAVHGRQGFLSRDHVLALLWPDQDDEHARGALNRAIYYLRHSLGEGILLSRGDDAIGLSRDTLWCDATELEAAATAGRHHRVLELYRGELLEGFHVSDTAEFGRWLDATRDHLKEIACRSAWSLAEAEHRTGNANLAVQWGRWAVERSPYDEASVQRLMSLLDGSGDRAGAVQEYERFVRRLANDLELTPSPETRTLLESIRSRDCATHNVTPAVGVNGNDTPARGAVSEGPHVVAREERAPAVDRPAATNADVARQRRAFVALRRPRSRRAAVAVTATVLATASVLFVATRRAAPDSRMVMVASLENRTGDATLDSLARMATDFIVRSVSDVVESTSAVAPMPAARVVQREDVGSLARLFARGERAGTVVSGELYREGELLHFRVRVVDNLRGGRAWAIPPTSATPGFAEQAVRELSQRATGAVASLRNPMLAEWFPVATAPPTYDALVEYLRGLDVARPWDSGRHFERAGQRDTTFTWALLEASGQGRMLDRDRAHAIVADLDGKREHLNRLQIAVLNSLLAREVGDRRSHYQAMAVAAGLAPERFLMEYAMAAWGLHLPRQALQLLDTVDAQRPSSGLTPSWWLRTELLHELREHRQELALTRRVRSLLPRDLNALSTQVRALAALGEVREVLALVDTAMSLPAETFYSPGTVMRLASEELRAHGSRAESAEMTRRAIEWYRGTPATSTKGHPSWHNYYLACALYQGGEWNRAQVLYQELADAEPAWRAEFYGSLGAIAARRGNRAEAEAYITALANLDIPSEAQPEDVGRARARIAALLGDAERALAFLREGYGGGQGTDLHTDLDFESVIEHDRSFQEFVRPKG